MAHYYCILKVNYISLFWKYKKIFIFFETRVCKIRVYYKSWVQKTRVFLKNILKKILKICYGTMKNSISPHSNTQKVIDL